MKKTCSLLLASCVAIVCMLALLAPFDGGSRIQDDPLPHFRFYLILCIPFAYSISLFGGVTSRLYSILLWLLIGGFSWLTVEESSNLMFLRLNLTNILPLCILLFASVIPHQRTRYQKWADAITVGAYAIFSLIPFYLATNGYIQDCSLALRCTSAGFWVTGVILLLRLIIFLKRKFTEHQ